MAPQVPNGIFIKLAVTSKKEKATKTTAKPYSGNDDARTIEVANYSEILLNKRKSETFSL